MNLLMAMKNVHSLSGYTRDPAESERFPSSARSPRLQCNRLSREENNFVKSVVAFAAVEGILSSAVSFRIIYWSKNRRLIRGLTFSKVPSQHARSSSFFCVASTAKVLPWVHWLRVVPRIAVLLGLSRILLASGFPWISVSEGYLAQILHAELSSNFLVEPEFTGRRRSSSLTVLTTLWTQQNNPLRLSAIVSASHRSLPAGLGSASLSLLSSVRHLAVAAFLLSWASCLASRAVELHAPFFTTVFSNWFFKRQQDFTPILTVSVFLLVPCL